MTRIRRKSGPGAPQPVPSDTKTTSRPFAHPTPHRPRKIEEEDGIPTTIHYIIEYGMILPLWLNIMHWLYCSCYISATFACFATIGFICFGPSLSNLIIVDTDFPLHIFNKLIARCVSNLLSNIRAEAASLLALVKDHEQHQRLKRAWAVFRMWHLPLVVIGIGKASESTALRWEGAVVICMVWALAQADRQENEELKAESEEMKTEIERLKERLAASESEGWSWVG